MEIEKKPTEIQHRWKSPVAIMGLVCSIVDCLTVWGLSTGFLSNDAVVAIVGICSAVQVFVAGNNPTSKNSY